MKNGVDQTFFRLKQKILQRVMFFNHYVHNHEGWRQNSFFKWKQNFWRWRVFWNWRQTLWTESLVPVGKNPLFWPTKPFWLVLCVAAIAFPPILYITDLLRNGVCSSQLKGTHSQKTTLIIECMHLLAVVINGSYVNNNLNPHIPQWKCTSKGLEHIYLESSNLWRVQEPII